MYSENRISFRHRLAFRLTVWYAGIFTLSSGVAFLLFYLLIAAFMQEQMDQELLGQAKRFATLLSVEGIESVQGAALVEAQAAGVKKVFFRLLSLEGRAFSSSNLAYWKDIPVAEKAARELLRNGRPVLETRTLPDPTGRIRILYALIGPDIILQVGQTMESQSRFLAAFRRIFVSTMALLIVGAAGLGWFLARRAVSGVEAVTRTAAKISAGSLGERVPVIGRGDEIDQLALTFNQMLDRIQGLLTEIKEMTDHLAHDLRSPLTRIRGQAEVTLATAKSLSEYQSLAADTVEESDRLLDLINTLLLISKTETGIQALAEAEVDLTALVRQACDLFLPAAEDKGVRWHCEVDEVRSVRGDIRLIQRMLANLLDNAVKYTPAGGSVDILLEEKRGRPTITVRDTGIGIAPEEQERIFNRFYRGDRSRSQEGFGLGLSLARAIARAHGGDLNVLSVLNQGATFTITLAPADSVVASPS